MHLGTRHPKTRYALTALGACCLLALSHGSSAVPLDDWATGATTAAFDCTGHARPKLRRCLQHPDRPVSGRRGLGLTEQRRPGGSAGAGLNGFDDARYTPDLWGTPPAAAMKHAG